jgi:rhamnosyltransferase subunit B
MKAIVVGLGSFGDVHPMVGLTLALKERGWKTVLVAPVIFKDLAGRLAIDFVGLGHEDEYRAALDDPDLWHPVRGFSAIARLLFIPALRRIYEIIALHHEPGETVVIAPITAIGARLAQEKLNVPLVSVHLQPITLRSVHEPPCLGFSDIIGRLPMFLRGTYLALLDHFLIDPVLAPETNAFRAELGLPPVRRLFHEWANSPRRVIGCFPEWFAPPQPDWPAQVELTGFPLYDESDSVHTPSRLREFLAAGDPPVVFTAGTGMTQAKEFFRVGVEVCRRISRRGILLTRFPAQLPGTLPETVRAFEYVPFSAVLPRASAIVHHGGIGTTAQALAAGIPQLVVPFAFDQPDNAARVRRLGVGDYLRPGSYTAARAARTLAALLASPSVRVSCERLSRSLKASDALDRSCDLIRKALGT